MDSDASMKTWKTRKKISQLLKHISEEDATLVQLYYLNEFSIKEIVEATGLTESNIKIKLFRARERWPNILTNILIPIKFAHMEEMMIRFLEGRCTNEEIDLLKKTLQYGRN